MRRFSYSIPEAATVVGVSDWCIRRAIQRGDLPAKRLGGRVIVIAADLAEYLNRLPTHKDSPPTRSVPVPPRDPRHDALPMWDEPVDDRAPATTINAVAK